MSFASSSTATHTSHNGCNNENNNIINNQISPDRSKNNTNTNTNNTPNNVKLHLVMSCDVFWDYETDVLVNRALFHPKFTNRPEEEAFGALSQFLCFQMKQHIEDALISEGRRHMLPDLERVYPKFHIHGQTVHEILYPNDPTNSDHCRGDGKIFICTHC
uniref:Uncharacterized protein n=1 Tax=viral metagenome TaxID=1070528 RepID=A0A6C0EW94_9ZZZZ